MFGKSIKARVNKVIKHRIKTAQKAHDERVKELDIALEEAKKRLEASTEQTKEESATKLVENIIGKIN